MNIVSFNFLFFVGVSLLIYWSLPKKVQWIFLLLDSLLFYYFNAPMWTLVYVIVTVVTAYGATNYFAWYDRQQLSLENAKKRVSKKVVLVGMILLNVGILAALKYTNLGIHTWNRLAGEAFGIVQDVNWVAPLAISYYTLQLVSYVLDCYWGVATAEKNVLKVGLYTCYFPQMIVGPISRHSQMAKQLFEEHHFDYTRVTFGMKRIAWGMVKKLAIANRISIFTDYIYANPETFTGVYVWVAAAAYVIQLYTDFSGGVDILLGVSQCFGIELPENFNAPLLSKSIQEFWRRWHMTLGTWLKDYIMNPLLKSDAFVRLGKWAKNKLGKKQGKKIPVYVAMFVLWTAMGVWHGNSWKYIIGEGWWFWFVIVLGQIMEPWSKRVLEVLHIQTENILWKTFQVIRTFVIFMFGNIFFRADSFLGALSFIKGGLTFEFDATLLNVLKDIGYANFGGNHGVMVFLLALLLFVLYEICSYGGYDVQVWLAKKSMPVRWIMYFFVLICIMVSYDVNAENFAFAYAQF